MVKLLQYGKNNKRYWDGSQLYKQVVTKALSIAEALHTRYLLLFLFDNATSHSLYADDALYITRINNKSKGKQIRLRNE